MSVRPGLPDLVQSDPLFPPASLGVIGSGGRGTLVMTTFQKDAAVRILTRAAKTSDPAEAVRFVHRLAEDPLGEGARGFDVLDVVEEHERLERCGGCWPGDGADFAIRGVEGDHVRRRDGALPVSVDAAPPQVGAR